MKHERGFTLIEVLAAIVLLSLILLGVYSGIRTATRIVHSGEERIGRMDEVRSTGQFVQREVAQALALPFAVTDEGDGIVFDGQPDAARFVAPLPGYLGKAGAQIMTLQLVRDNNSNRLQVTFSLLPPDGSPPVAPGDPEILLAGVNSGSFAYRGYDDQGNPGPWVDRWPDGRRLPSMIALRMKLAGGVGSPEIIAPLRIDPTSVNGRNPLGNLPRRPAVLR
ncbi:MAG TPA: prepilin-type N-terminal cleavage/methylation domain-containing protein [Pinirhizobacter sp.]|uniref:prepilin-type N-terminal cleavage/methylation domain-containing protein n=1 Tax=Pinirhizobacter sp. TaxID=2950432 RepID=UPI002C06AD0E|nr:prepilin-type N-terminal cleavage/methylation domain-containing protein [Pinirhizobacter sp.]HMH68739.1 prepilin-type N-terminal cleavage/methylation domain-containing protein [Pinirhizobacter sp.]